MTIVVPVAIAAPSLPLPDPADRATFSARKLEHLRWAAENLAPGANALAANVLNNANEVKSYADQVYTNTVATANNTAQAALYAGAAAFVPNAVYVIDVVVKSTVNSLMYRRLSAGGAAADPANDPTNWQRVNTAAPFQAVTASAVQAVSGGAYALTNSTAQAAATNLCLYSEDFYNAYWTKSGVTVTSAASEVMPDGAYTAELLTVSSAVDTYLGAGVFTTALGAVHSVHVKQGGSVPASGVTLRLITFATGVTDDVLYFDMLTRTFSAALGILAGLSGYGYAYMGNGVYRVWAAKAAQVGQTGSQLRFRPGGGANGTLADTCIAWGAQSESGTTPSSYIPTTSAAVTRAAGEIAPQRVVLPANPVANDRVDFAVANNTLKNVIDPNGQLFAGPAGTFAGPAQLDGKAVGAVQFINNAWKFI